MKKVLVAGATGYLGKFVIKECKRQGYWVRVLARNPAKLEKEGPYGEPAVIKQVDEVFQGEATDPDTLQGVCDGIDIVFSSIGITRQKDKVSFFEVDYQGNVNILKQAQASSVKKFVFVSVFHASLLGDIDIVKAREMFVEELMQTDIDYAVIRPTGYFSDMTEFLKMAESGRVYLLGSGKNKMNPIHGADLAEICVEAFSVEANEITAGGPEVFTYEEIARLAFSVLGRDPRIVKIPGWIVHIMLKIIAPFNKRWSSLGRFFTVSMQMDQEAPRRGRHFLKPYYQSYV